MPVPAVWWHRFLTCIIRKNVQTYIEEPPLAPSISNQYTNLSDYLLRTHYGEVPPCRSIHHSYGDTHCRIMRTWRLISAVSLSSISLVRSNVTALMTACRYSNGALLTPQWRLCDTSVSACHTHKASPHNSRLYLGRVLKGPMSSGS